jgi:cobalt-precorrin 5A hydrolase
MDRYAEAAGLIPLQDSLARWTAAVFSENDALVFVGASGIAVRAIAPHVRDKSLDPAVAVVDEKGRYAISLLSGHLGGANDITLEIAGIIGAEPVITTATDINQRFAVDGWAKKNQLQIGDMQLAKEISAAVLRGETVGVSSDDPIDGEPPEQLLYIEKENGTGQPQTACPEIGFRISIRDNEEPFEKTLHLIPRTATVGMGCRKGTTAEAAEELLNKVLKEHGISVRSVEKLCSIDIKKDEAALIQLAEKLGVPFEVFSAEELDRLEGKFTASGFVSRVTGVDNVCERAAVLGSRGELIVGKQAQGGVTAAIAVRKEGYRWKQQ